MRIAIVGCGYAADYYVLTLPNHPSLDLVGVYDINAERQGEFCKYHELAGYPSLSALLADPAVDLVVNLTSPRSHFEVSREALAAGKHVYSEKPLALQLDEAVELGELAARQGVLLASAPSNLLGAPLQTAWWAVRNGAIGTPRLVYAELDAGAILQMSPDKWVNMSGAKFPYVDEFSTGWTVVHAAYHLSSLSAIFGPVVHLNAFSADVMPVHQFASDEALPPDFAVSCLTFGDGVVARLTSSIAFKRDQSFRIEGDEGTLTLEDSGHFGSQVTVARPSAGTPVALPLLANGVELRCPEMFRNYDFAGGVADLAAAATREDHQHLPLDHALHVLELTLAISEARRGITLKPRTTFEPVPFPKWAQ